MRLCHNVILSVSEGSRIFNYRRDSCLAGRQASAAEFTLERSEGLPQNDKMVSLKDCDPVSMPKKLSNILIINPFGIGDVLFSTAVVDAIARQIEGCNVGFLCNRRTEPLLKYNPDLKWVFVFEKDEYRQLWKTSKLECVKKFRLLLKEIKSKKFDAVIDLSLSRQFGFFTWLLGIPRRVGFNYKKRGIFLTRKLDISGYNDKHMVEYYLSLLDLLNLKPLSCRPKVYLSESDRRWAELFLREAGINKDDLIIGVIPGGGASWGKDAGIKHWNKAGFSEISDELIEKRKARIIIFGDESETGICDAVRKNMRNPIISACGKTTLSQFAALVSMCRLVIANDGGPLHLAAAMQTSTVGIFGPVSEKVYGQYPPGKNHKIIKSEIECRPCYKNFKLRNCADKRCLNEISSRQTLKAAEDALEER
ncbi:MAG: glycosyltransferase family 9 protein [Candidatus Omnitrophota bacterium]